MTTMFQRSSLFAAVLAGFVMVACSPMKEPAAAALADANAALQKVAPEATQYAPTEYAALNEQVTAMKAAFDRQDYQAVLNTVRKLAPSLHMLAETVSARKREAGIALKEQWVGLLRDAPTALSAAASRVADLNKTHRLPKGVSKDTLAGAGAVVDAAKQDWSEAQSAHQAGNLQDAVAKGKAAQEKLGALMTSLGTASPGAK